MILLCAVSGAVAQQGGVAPLPIELPKPLFEGTPVDNRIPNLEKPLGQARPPFLAPVGTKNVSRGKPVTASGGAALSGQVEMITDGVKTGVDGSFVELPAGFQSVVIDLEEKQTIYAVLVWHYLKQARVYFDVAVQVADDPDFIENVRTIFNNDHDNTSGLGIGKDRNYIETAEGKLIDAKGVEARYIRFWSAGNNVSTGSHYVEIEVFGKPTK
jgi:hypothetical protein